MEQKFQTDAMSTDQIVDILTKILKFVKQIDPDGIKRVLEDKEVKALIEKIKENRWSVSLWRDLIQEVLKDYNQTTISPTTSA